MAIPITEESQRKYPLNQPQGWKPKIPRYTLRLSKDVSELAIANIGVQARDGNKPSSHAVIFIEEWLLSEHKPLAIDRFEVLLGRDQPSTRVYACCWVSKQAARDSIAELDLKQVFNRLPAEQRAFSGVWLEYFEPDLTRFETNYSGTDYQPGIAQLSGTEQAPHDLTGYWGAARDRIHASAYDRFEDLDVSSASSVSSSSFRPPTPQPDAIMEQVTYAADLPDFENPALGAIVSGTNTRTIAHIRSGQFWENCAQEESDAYEEKLERHLVNGLHDVLDHPIEKGDFGLRFVRNIPSEPQSHTRKETCALGFFRSLTDLENWAKDCPSHHKIYGGAMSHKYRFGDATKMRTWHEISILKPGKARWQYVNCDPSTGILPFVKHDAIEKFELPS